MRRQNPTPSRSVRRPASGRRARRVRRSWFALRFSGRRLRDRAPRRCDRGGPRPRPTGRYRRVATRTLAATSAGMPWPSQQHNMPATWTQRTQDQAGPMTEPIGEPAGRDLEPDEHQVAGRQDGGDHGGRNLTLLYPPQEIQPVHQPLYAGHLVGQVEGEVSTTRRSIRRHRFQPYCLRILPPNRP